MEEEAQGLSGSHQHDGVEHMAECYTSLEFGTVYY